MVYIVEHDEEGPVLASAIARQGRLPQKYLSHILREAVRAGLLVSTRGRGGGFRLARPACQISLAEVLAPFDPSSAERTCPFGLAKCSDSNPCPIHEQWGQITGRFHMMLERTTLRELTERRGSKRRSRGKPAGRGRQGK